MKVSPSPVATEAQDFNVMLGNAAGEVCYVGPFVQFHAVILDLLDQAHDRDPAERTSGSTRATYS